LLGLAACAPERPRDEASEADATLAAGEMSTKRVDPSGSCTLTEVDRRSVALASGLDVYVEPQAVGTFQDGLFMLGQPTYEWFVAQDGRVTRASAHRFLGVTIDEGGGSAIPHVPGVAHVGAVKVARMASDRLLLLMEEIDRPSSLDAEALRVVSAEYAAGEWSSAMGLPWPGEGRLAFEGSSAMVGPGDDGRVLWAVPWFGPRGGVDVLLYEYDGRRWSWTVAAEDWADEVGLFRFPQRPLTLAIGGLDPELGSQLASIRVHRRADTWSPAQRLDLGSPGARYRRPTFLAFADELDLAWLRVDGTGESEAWVMARLHESEVGAPALLDDAAVYMVGVPSVDGGPTFILTYHANALLASRRLRVFRRDAVGYASVGSIEYPFVGPFAAIATAADELLVFGPEATFDLTTPFVRSLIIRLNSCA